MGPNRTYKHFRSVRYEKWSYYGYFIAFKPFLTATFLDIAVSRDFCVFWIWRPLDANPKRPWSGEKLCMAHINTLDALGMRNGAIACIL